MDTTEKPAPLTLTDLPSELLEVIVSYVEGSDPVSETSRTSDSNFSNEPKNPMPWAFDGPGCNPKALEMVKDCNVMHSGNWMAQLRRIEALRQLATTCRLLNEVKKHATLPRHLFIDLYSPRMGSLQRPSAYKPLARTDDTDLVELSSQPIYNMFRLVSTS
jgi:hypothetical protein